MSNSTSTQWFPQVLMVMMGLPLLNTEQLPKDLTVPFLASSQL